jgi:tetratricopeptide (TPR) repeat protein
MRQLTYLITLAFAISFHTVKAQSGIDHQLAIEYYNSGDFEKAAMYFEKLHTQSPTKFYFNNYFNSLLKLERYKDAEKLAKKQMRLMPDELSIYVMVGKLHAAQNDEAKAKEFYDKAIKNISSSNRIGDIENLATAFRMEELPQYALQTYQKAEKVLPVSPWQFKGSIAEVYAQLGETSNMVNTYLDLIDANKSFLFSVQSLMSRKFDFTVDDEKNEILRVELIKRVQKNPDKEHFSELLIWYFEQRSDYESALLQAKAFDKRTSSPGYKVMDLGDFCMINRKYSIAIEAYKHVADQGVKNPLYFTARIKYVDALRMKITENRYTDEELKTLNQEYTNLLTDLGENEMSVSVMIDQARLYTYYFHKPKKGIEILERALSIPSINNTQSSEIKMELADAFMVSGDIWEASLLYSQVEKANKHDVIGFEAKFRNAKVMYYSGDFELAQSRLNSLKTSTSKLISNDALELSILITDNLGIDSNTTLLSYFSMADLLIFQNKLNEANLILDSILHGNPGHPITDEALYRKYQIAQKQGEYKNAEEYLTKIIKDFKDDILADKALFKLGELYYYYLDDKEKAAEAYKQLMIDFPGSLFSAESRKRFRELRGDETESPRKTIDKT